MGRNNTHEQSNITCQYVVEGVPVHSKLYIWEKDGTPYRAFMGSANYTQSAFSRRRREIIQECDPNLATNYFEIVERNSMYCTHAEILFSHRLILYYQQKKIHLFLFVVQAFTVSLYHCYHEREKQVHGQCHFLQTG